LGALSFTDNDLNWAFHYFRTADLNQDLMVTYDELVNNVNGDDSTKEKLRIFFRDIDENGDGSIDFAEWFKWGARDGQKLLLDIQREFGIPAAVMEDAKATLPCGEEKLKLIEEEMRRNGEFDCPVPV
jgi:hypothetical protein